MASLSALISRVSELARTMGDSLQLRGFKPGGTDGQVPVKGAGGDFDWEWESVSGVGGGVTTFAELTDKATANIPAINSYVAPKASPTFTGTVTIPSGALISGYLTSAAAALTYQPLSAILTATDASFTTTIATRLENTSGTNTGDQTYTTLTGGAANYVPMDITPTSIPTTEGTLSWNADDHTLNIQTDITGTVIQAGLESLTRVRNVSGSPIANGSVVYINGSSGQRPTVALAISTNDTHALSTIGLATADIAHNAFGFITVVGLVRGIDTTGIVEGTPLYLSASTAGGITATPPTTNRIRIGWVAVEANNGTVLVGVEKQSVKSSEVSDATDANTANMIVKRDASGRASLELYNSTISGTVTFGTGGKAAMLAALEIAPLIEADVITGTSTTPGIISPALLKIAAETHGTGGGTDPHDPTKAVVIECEFYSASATYINGCGLTTASNNSGGSVALTAPTTEHPGILTISDSATAGGGYRILTDITGLLIAGGEESTFCFRPDDQRATNVSRMGFQDTAAIGEPTDACMLKTIGNGAGGVTVSGVCRSSSSETATASTGTLTTGTWYRGEIVINSAATLATFTVKDDAGATVWTDTVATNIPTGSGRVTGWGIAAFESTTDAATSIISIDYAKLQITRTLAR